jgi:DNA primase
MVRVDVQRFHKPGVLRSIMRAYGVRGSTGGIIWKRGVCPFCEKTKERSRSFAVDDGRGVFFCHKCGTKGNAIGFVMMMDGVQFKEAVAKVSHLSGEPVQFLLV